MTDTSATPTPPSDTTPPAAATPGGNGADGTPPASTSGADGTPPAAAAAAAATPGGNGAPEAYSFTWPDGFTPDAAQLAEYEADFRAAGLSQEAAQKIVGRFADAQVAAIKQLDEDVTKQTNEWQAAVKADADMGGAKYDATVKAAEHAMGKFGTPALKQWLDTTGLTNHPELVRMFAKVGKAIAEDNLSGTGRSNGGRPASIENRMYPSH